MRSAAAPFRTPCSPFRIPKGDTLVVVAEAVNVREILLDSSSFGQDKIERLERAIAGPQASEVRQHLRELQTRIEQGESSEPALLAAGVTAYYMGRHEAANRFLSQFSGNALAEFYHAQVLMALERYQEAAEKYEQAAKLGYDAVTCALLRAGAVRLMGRLDEAEELLRETGREGATRAEYSYQMGCIRADRGDTFGAVEYFERAVDMDPHHTAALFRLANEMNLLGNDNEAIKLYERALSKPPLYLGALINLGLLYEDNENYRAAAFCFQRVLQVYPNHQRARLYLKDIQAASDMYYDEDALRRQKEIDQVMQIPITDFELSARSRNCLERAGIYTLGDLAHTTEQDLLAGKNFGETSLREIREILESRGLHIGQFAQAPAQPSAFFESPDVSPQEKAMLERPVTDLNLSVRSRKCLARLGITSLAELVARTADELMSVRNFGVTSLNEIRAKLTEQGLKLRND